MEKVLEFLKAVLDKMPAKAFVAMFGIAALWYLPEQFTGMAPMNFGIAQGGIIFIVVALFFVKFQKKG